MMLKSFNSRYDLVKHLEPKLIKIYEGIERATNVFPTTEHRMLLAKIGVLENSTRASRYTLTDVTKDILGLKHIREEDEFDDLNFTNLVWFYKPELLRIINGENPKNLFTQYGRSTLIKKNILAKVSSSKGGRQVVLSYETKEALSNMGL